MCFETYHNVSNPERKDIERVFKFIAHTKLSTKPKSANHPSKSKQLKETEPLTVSDFALMPSTPEKIPAKLEQILIAYS